MWWANSWGAEDHIVRQTGNLPVRVTGEESRVHLTFASVQHNAQPACPTGHGVGKCEECRDAGNPLRQGIGKPFCRAERDAQTGEGSRADCHSDTGDLGQTDICLVKNTMNQGKRFSA